MEVYEIKRKIKQKNEWIYNILKKIGSVWSYIKRIPIKFREYKKIKQSYFHSLLKKIRIR